MIYYSQQESPTLEWKREVPTKQQIIKTMIGFCNMHGGKLIIGVDNQGIVVGIDESKIAELIEDLHRSIYASCTPPILPSLSVQRVGDKAILLIEVSEGMLKPYFLSSLGREEGTYIRVGTQTVKATPGMLQELSWQSTGKYIDQMPIHPATCDDLAMRSIESVFQRKRAHVTPSEMQELILHYQIVTNEYGRLYPTLGGILLFGKNPQKFLPESMIICTHFSGTAGREVIATRDCEGTLLQQYNDCITFIASRLNKQFQISGTDKRKETLEIPEEAIREIVVNALVHRNYLIPGPTKIAIYDDRLEVFSPGNFPGPIQIDHLSLGVSYIRNMIIARIFREIGLAEKLGSGFLTLFSSYETYNLPTPTVVEGTGFVKCILPRYQITTNFVSKHPLAQLFCKKREISVLDVMKYLEVSRATANRELRKWLDQGLIEKIGKGPRSRYTQND
ncbi:MAG: putative DNA binding domain-containing protein [Verrucomicrobiota bacterium]|nr:putative DNA binding domain-containing protein [Verrucomicrobiota bacterium]